MIATSPKISRNPKTTLDDMRKINNGFLRHEGLELPGEYLKHVVAHSNGEISDRELEKRICGLGGNER